jgi:hypothetical protein
MWEQGHRSSYFGWSQKDDFDSNHTTIVANKQKLIQLCKDNFSAMTSYLHDFLQFFYLFVLVTTVPKSLNNSSFLVISFMPKKVENEKRQD